MAALLKAGTAGVLLGVAHENNGLSVFTKDQVKTNPFAIYIHIYIFFIVLFKIMII